MFTRTRLPLRLGLPRLSLVGAGMCLALLAGTGLRTVWLADMEYKGDEVWTFERTQHAGVDEPIPALGMPTSYELRHPGGTIWVFIVLAKVFGLTTPTELGRACQLVNVSALILLVAFALRCVPRGEREPWLWAAALACVNPLDVVFHRKIWPPSIVPLFVMMALAAWWHRGGRGGAFFWGLLSVLVGQLHPAGLFLALGFAAWTFAFDRWSARWRFWAAGCAVASATLVPWLLYVFETTGQNPISQRKIGNIITARFWVNWVTEADGISVHYALGDDFWDYIRHPVFADVPTYGVAAVHVLMLATGVAILARALLYTRRMGWRGVWEEATGQTSQTALAAACGVFGFGILFTLTCLPVHRHYMNLTFPLIYLWLALLALTPSRAEARPAGRGPLARLTRGRTLLLAMGLLQFCVSASFLSYIHASQRPIRGDYGTPYRVQVAEGGAAHSE